MSNAEIERAPSGLLRLMLTQRREEARELLASVTDPSQGAFASVRPGSPADSWLHVCARQGHYQETLEAAKRSSDVDRPEKDAGATPFLLAVGHCNLEGALALLDAGANSLARDRDGLGVLHHAAFSADLALLNLALALAPEQLNERPVGNDEMLILLDQAPAEPDPDYDWGRRGGDRSYWSKSERAEPPERSELFENEGLAPIECAIEGQNAEALEFLIGAGADARARSRHGMTLLGSAASGGSVALVTILLGAGAPIDELDSSGSSALRRAAMAGRAACAKALLEAGADPDARGPLSPGSARLRESAREAAAQSKNEEIRALFESYALAAEIGSAARRVKVARGL